VYVHIHLHVIETCSLHVYPEDSGRNILQNVGSLLQNNIVLQHKSSRMLWKP